MKKPRAFLLLIVLGFSAALVVLFLSLFLQGQSLSTLLRRENTHSDREQVTIDTNARMGLVLSDDPAHPLPASARGRASATQDFTSSPHLSNATSSVSWGRGGASMRYPTATGYSTYDNMFTTKGSSTSVNTDYIPTGDAYGPMPRVGYQDDLVHNSSGGVPLSPGHTLMTQQKLSGPDVVTVYDQCFPYGAYAPTGSVILGSVVAWANPTLDAWDKNPPQEGDTLAYATGVPVMVRAQGAIKINGNFPCGRAYSQQGPISAKGGALCFTGSQAGDDYCERLSAQVTRAISSLSAGTLNKSKWIAGRGLSLSNVRDLFQGKFASFLDSFLTAEQAFQFPIPPIPVVQEDELVTVLLIHHPWPADFSGSSSDKSKIDDMKALAQDIKAQQQEISRLTAEMTATNTEINNLQAEINNPKTSKEQRATDQQKLQADQQKYQTDQGKIDDDNAAISQDKKKIQNIQDEIAKEGQSTLVNPPGKIPQTAWEDATQPAGSGWAYAVIAAELVNAFNAAIEGHLGDFLSDIVPPIRMVHFGSMDPEWVFSDNENWPFSGKNGYVLKSTLDVPRGKTMKLSGPRDTFGSHIEIQGDVWIQRGATLYVNGNLLVSKPASWSDYYGVQNAPLNPKDDPNDFQPSNVPQNDTDNRPNPLYPWGRVILEEGATLVVAGDLNVTGGHRELGSVICCSRIGSTRGINTAILCQGNVTLAHGVYSGMTLEDLTNRLMLKEVPSLAGFYSQFLDPALNFLIPNVCKIFGPFNARNPCYFAQYATTIVFCNFLAEFGLAEIPVPFPLPCPNMERKFFTWLSLIYSYELNMNLGENFYTQTSWWLLGRGVAPFFLKVSPGVVAGAFQNLNYPNILADVGREAFKDFISNVLPEMAKAVLNEVVVEVFSTILKEVIPFDCADAPSSNQDQVESDIEAEMAREIGNIIANEVKKQLMRAVQSCVTQIKDAILNKADSTLNADYMCREMPGVFVYSGQALQIGISGDEESAVTASGFFYAEDDVDIAANRIVGAMVSRGGSIRATGTLFYYPYFTQASLYNPPKPSQYNDLPTDDLRNMMQFTTPNPNSNTSIDLGVPTARVTATGDAK